MGECFICKSRATVDRYSDGNSYLIECPRCGNFRVTCEAKEYYEKKKNKNSHAIFSHWIRMHQAPNWVDLDQRECEALISIYELSKPSEQISDLLLYLGNSAEKPSQHIDCLLLPLASIIGAVDVEDVIYHIHTMQNNRLLVIHSPIAGYPEYDSELERYVVQLTFEGWNAYYELLKSNKDSRLAFMAMQFDNAELQKLFEVVIVDAIKQTGYQIRKVSDVKRAGSIDDKIKVEIRKSKFLIADLSDENRGAYWEAGFASGLGIEVIYICERNKFSNLSTHFDTNHQHTIMWDKDKSKWNEFAEELKATIRETFPEEAKMED